jgi:uncharacterized membrane protein
MTPLLFAFLIGLLSGLRAITPSAATAWAAHWGWLKLPRTLVWLSTISGAVFFTGLALLELTTDKLPSTFRRTAPMQLIVRLILGAFTGECIATSAGQRAILGILLGATGALAGTYGGYYTRAGLAKLFNSPDLPIALCEDILTISASFYLVSHL